MTQPIGLSRLASHLNAQLQHDWPGWSEEISQGSDRVAALVGTTLLDELIGTLLQGFFIDTAGMPNAERLTPPHDFRPRIDLAFALGLIPRDLYHDLDRIRQIRNVFAHALHGVSFQTTEIAHVCTTLKLPADVLLAEWLPELTPRLQFLIAVVYAGMELQVRIMDVKHCEVPTNEYNRPRWNPPEDPSQQTMGLPFWKLDPEGKRIRQDANKDKEMR